MGEQPSRGAGGKLLLASASQDRTLRIWAVAPAGSPAAGSGRTSDLANGHPAQDSSDFAKAIARCWNGLAAL